MPDFRHFFLPKNGLPEGYTATGGGSGEFTAPPRDRQRHARKLLDQLQNVHNMLTSSLQSNQLPAAFILSPSHSKVRPILNWMSTDSKTKPKGFESST